MACSDSGIFDDDGAAIEASITTGQLLSAAGYDPTDRYGEVIKLTTFKRLECEVTQNL